MQKKVKVKGSDLRLVKYESLTPRQKIALLIREGKRKRVLV